MNPAELQAIAEQIATNRGVPLDAVLARLNLVLQASTVPEMLLPDGSLNPAWVQTTDFDSNTWNRHKLLKLIPK